MNGEEKSIRELLLEEMKHGIYADSERLPRETVLAEKLKISRTQLREALTDLEREGFITRRHGVGTVINRHVVRVKNRMDIETEFLDIIRCHGYEPSLGFVRATEETADKIQAEKLHISVGEKIICIRLLCLADGRPAIYTEDVLKKSLLKKDCQLEGLWMNIFQFMKEYCDVEPYMDLTELQAVAADERISDILNVACGMPLLHMEEIDYDIEGQPVFYSRQYFVNELIRHTVLRKKF